MEFSENIRLRLQKDGRDILIMNYSESVRDAIMRGDIPTIEKSLNSDNNLAIIFSIVAVVKYKIKLDSINKRLKILKSKDEFEFCANISDYACAALDILDIEKYLGNDKSILQLIKSNLDFY